MNVEDVWRKKECPFYREIAKTKIHVYNNICLYPENYSPHCCDTNFCFFRSFTEVDKQLLERIQKKARWWGFEELPDRAMLNFCEKNKGRVFRGGEVEELINQAVNLPEELIVMRKREARRRRRER